MTDASATAGPAPDQPTRPYSPGLEGVIAGETSLSLVDGERGRLLYRGYRIGDLVAGFLYQLNGVKPEAEAARALDAYFVVGAEHGFNASTFTARVITSTRADIASAVCGAIGALKGPLHGGAPSEVVEQIHQVGSPERAEAWVRDALATQVRLMGLGLRV
jgi:citrate synthase